MNELTIKALNESISKYKSYVKILKANIGKKLVDVKNIKLGADNCALCNLFFNKNCVDCPIMEKTGEMDCDETPYQKIFPNYNLLCFHGKNINKSLIELFQKEVDFLESLRENDK